MDRRYFLQSLGIAAAWPAGALAQSPGRPIRIVLSLPAGSAIDFQARLVAPHLATSLGQPVVIDNKPGGKDIIAMQDVIKSAPDGHTLYMGSLSPLAINVALVKGLPYDPRRHVTPIAGMALTNHVLMVRSDFPAKTFGEFIAYVKQRPGSVSIAHATTLVQTQIATLNRMAGIELLPIPYKGTSQTITDVIGGALQATLLDPGNALAQMKGGQLRALAVTSLKRNPLTPDLPAISETLPGFDFSAWTAMVGPAGMSSEVVQRINAAMNQALRHKDVTEKLAQAATLPLILSPEELKALIESDTARWIKLTREANIQPE
ncbi:Bug family tripartite tricarboxylate transporter substrate binding protein [Azohydromonas australica]|uniref:Bug family tripartite tricarboxylate transporter substrate binding protein n=1 Tax=Azohydromonas australica TaxID=364039 RepID=UPI0004131B4E|nr:tripartite tricarboxylate transporter substrate binding protein [Azohydromonas australica]